MSTLGSESNSKEKNSIDSSKMTTEDHLERIQNEKTVHFQTTEEGEQSTNPNTNQRLGVYHNVKGYLQRGLGELVNSETLQFKGEAEMEKGQTKLERSQDSNE